MTDAPGGKSTGETWEQLVARLHAELATERDRTEAWKKAASSHYDGLQVLKKQLAAERERYAKLEGLYRVNLELLQGMQERYAKLEAENARLRSQLKGKTFPAYLDQALNEGDGTYRP